MIKKVIYSLVFIVSVFLVIKGMRFMDIRDVYYVGRINMFACELYLYNRKYQ